MEHEDTAEELPEGGTKTRRARLHGSGGEETEHSGQASSRA